MLEFQNIKTFFAKVYPEVGQKKFLLLMKLKIELQKTIQKEFRTEKVLKRKSDELYVKWKGMIIVLIVGLIKKISYKNESVLS